MALTDINYGTTANDGTGNTLREGAIIINANNAILQDLLDNAARVDTVNTFQLDQTFSGSISVEQSSVFEDSVSILGNLYVQGTGSEIITETINSESDYITMRYNNPVALGGSEYSGFEINNYDGTNSMYLNVGLDGVWRMGEIGSFVAIAGREDAPTNGGYAIWNDTTSIFDTKSAAQTAIDINYWTKNGSDLYYLNNTGIGTPNPQGKFHIYNASTFANIFQTTSGNNVSIDLMESGYDFGSTVGNNGTRLLMDGASNLFKIQMGVGESVIDAVAIGRTTGDVAIGSNLAVDGIVTATGAEINGTIKENGYNVFDDAPTTLTITSGTATVNMKSGGGYNATLTQNTTFGFSNIKVGHGKDIRVTPSTNTLDFVQSGVSFVGSGVDSGSVQLTESVDNYITVFFRSLTECIVSVNPNN